MRYLIALGLSLALMACGKAPTASEASSEICGVSYAKADNGIIINPSSGTLPLPFSFYKIISDNEVLLESGTYVVKGECVFEVKDGTPSFYKNYHNS